LSEEQVARVYAQALFDAARDAGAAEPVGRDLGDFVAALAASASLRDVLADPRVDTSAKQRILVEITREGQPLVANTLQLLLERGRFRPRRRAARGLRGARRDRGGPRQGRGDLRRGAHRGRP